MIVFSLQADLRPLKRAFADLEAKQLPFAKALGLTRLAQGVQAIERQTVDETFDSPTPFTENAFAIIPATKSNPVAVVFPKDIQAEYLAPYVVGGDRSLGNKRAMLVPIGVGVNQYGNLPRNKIAQLKSKPGVFVGTVKTKSGRTISGVWQRPTALPAATQRRRRRAGLSPRGGHLKLLVQFQETTPVPKRLPFYDRAQAYLETHAVAEMSRAIGIARATARP